MALKKKDQKMMRAIYSLGPEQSTNEFLKSLDLHQMRSVIGSAHIKDIGNIRELLENNSSILFDPQEHIYKIQRRIQREKQRVRMQKTIIKKFDRGFIDATLPSDELWRSETKLDITEAVKRLNIIKEEKIPILFVYMIWEEKIIPTAFNKLTDQKSLEKLSSWLGDEYNCEVVVVILEKEIKNGQIDAVKEIANNLIILKYQQDDIYKVKDYLRGRIELNNFEKISNTKEEN